MAQQKSDALYSSHKAISLKMLASSPLAVNQTPILFLFFKKHTPNYSFPN